MDQQSFNSLSGIGSIQDLEEFKTQIFTRYYSEHNMSFYSTNTVSREDNPNFFAKWGKKNLDCDPNFKYDLNEHGFRSNPIAVDADICFYGCSYTFGTGVPIDRRWTNIVDKDGMCSNNFGLCGLSPSEILQLFVATTRIIKMKTAVLLLPDYARVLMPLVYKNNDIRYSFIFPQTVTDVTGSDPEQKRAAKLYYSFPEEFYIDTFKNSFNNAKYIAELKGIKLIVSTWSENTKNILNSFAPEVDCLWFNQIDKGRDDFHPGVHSHDVFGKMIGDRL